MGIRDLILSKKLPNVEAIGPMVPYFSMLGDRHRRNVLVRFKDPKAVKTVLKELLDAYAGKGGVGITIDIDPLEY